jgi:hypothetical protein
MPSPHADKTPSPQAAPVVAHKTISPDKLDQSVKKVTARSEYSWRVPRKSAPDAPKPKSWWERFKERMEKDRREAAKRPQPQQQESHSSGPSFFGGFGAIAQTLTWILLIAAAAALVVLLVKFFTGRNRDVKESDEPETATPVTDITSESVSAADLPEDEWLVMARQYMEKGDYRLALRAMYLAMLAALGRNNLLTIARFKSNRDYAAELARRAHWAPQALQAFGGNIRSFEEAWYGLHDVGREHIERFQINQQRIRDVETP